VPILRDNRRPERMTKFDKCMNLFPPSVVENDKSPDFGIEIDEKCQMIHDACKGWGTRDKDLIAAIGGTLAEDRHKLSLRYPQLYNGQDLRKLMDKESHGHYGTALEFCALGPAVAECAMIQKATKGLGTNEHLLYSIIMGRSNEEIAFLKTTYYDTYTDDLGRIVSKELSGDLRKLAVSCLQGAEEEYDPDYHTEEKALEDALDLYKAGQGKWFGTDEKKMFKIVALSPPIYLKMISKAYVDKYGYSLIKAMEKELSGKAKRAAVFACGMKIKPLETIAQLIDDACKGMGTDDNLLISGIIRYQHIMGDVNAAHIEMFGRSIHDRIREETKGDYKDLLLTLMNKVYPEY